jgi:hypothetical protein
MMKTSLICTLAAALAAFSTGCNRDSVKVYHVETDDSAAPQVPAAATATPAATADSSTMPAQAGTTVPQLRYTLPDSWQEKTPAEIRVASFGISENGKNADVSVIPLGGMAGGDLANVDRWRGQIGLQPLADADLQKLAEKVEVAGQPADLYDASGMKPGGNEAERIIGVILHRDDTSWFFKMTGDADLVEKQKPTFVSFLKSFQFGDLAAPSTMDLSQLPPSHPAIPGMDAGNVTAQVADAGDKPTWTVPAGWQEGQLTQFLVAKYIIAGADDAQAAVNVSSLAGDGGGLAANVNRWRGQLGLPPVAEILTSSIDVAGGNAQVVDFTGTDSKTGKPARLVGAVVPQNGQTWFYKLMGDESVVAQQKDAFMKFIQSAEYPDAH